MPRPYTLRRWRFVQYNDTMYVVWHHHEHINFYTCKMIWNCFRACQCNVTILVQNDLSIGHFAEKMRPLMGTERDEKSPSRGVIPML